MVSGVEFQITPIGGGAALKVTVPLVAVVGTNKVPVRDVLAKVPAGVYDLRARFLDPGGQPSIYSDPALSLRVRVKNPPQPTNVGVVDN